jgi:hypothetical protein
MPPHDFIKGEGGPDTLWPIWNLAKRISLNVQAHLSAFLALTIVIIMVVRESAELRDLGHEPRWLLFVFLAVGIWFSARYVWLLYMPVKLRWQGHVLYSLTFAMTLVSAVVFGPSLLDLYHSGRFRLVIVVLAAATILAALWEVFGDKLSSSHRDIWFSVAMREAIRQFDEVLTREQPMSKDELIDWYLNFLDWVLEYASAALCGRKRVQAGFLIKPPDRADVLRLFRASAGSDYPAGLEVPLPTRDHGGSAAGLAFTLERPGVVYVPYRKRKEAWTRCWTQRLTYNLSDHPEDAWTELKGQPWFESSLSVPVYFYDREHRTTARVAGILAFSTKAPDPFEPPDYLMAECFAHLISQALYLKDTLQNAPPKKHDA